MELQLLIYAFALLFGLIVGSFLNVVILRLPAEGGSIVFPASHCPKCGYVLRWYDNIPLLSYLMLKGKCRGCKQHISWQYPLVELAMGLLSVFLMYRFSPTFEYLFYFALAAALLVIIFIDIQHQIIPDVISLPGIVVGLAGAFFCTRVSWHEALLGALCGAGALYLVAEFYLLIRGREGMGLGDSKLLAMLGAFLGLKSLLFIVLFASLSGAIIGTLILIRQKKGSQTPIPFGPFLGFAALVYLFFQDAISKLWLAYLQLGGQ